jgi:hypothetical protein
MATQNAVNNVEIDRAVIDAAGDLVVGSGSDTATRLAIGSEGEVLMVKTSALSWEPIGVSTVWTVEAGASVAGAVNCGNHATETTVTIPTTAAVGSVVRVSAMHATGKWKVAQNAGETIYVGNQSTTPGAGGYLESTARGDAVELVCVVADTDWIVVSMVGNITYV